MIQRLGKYKMEGNCNINCKCGKFQAELREFKKGIRAICYFVDCQAFANHLKNTHDITNALGGTEIIAVRPQQIFISAGKNLLSCLSLTESGSLRWITTCCATPICNMSRNIRTAHIVIIHTCLDRNDINSTFGSKSLHVKRASALGTPPKSNFTYFISSVLYYFSSKNLDALCTPISTEPIYQSGHEKTYCIARCYRTE